MTNKNDRIVSDKERSGKRLLFVCLGNICRSPAAEAVMRKKLEEMHPALQDVSVDSAGIGAWHIGQLPDRRMRRTGERHGYDISSTARQVREADFARFDYIFGMDRENVRDLERMRADAIRHGVVSKEGCARVLCAADFMTRHPGFKTVPDPYHGNEQDFELALELIKDACDGIINKLLLA